MTTNSLRKRKGVFPEILRNWRLYAMFLPVAILINGLLKDWNMTPLDIYADANLWPILLPIFYVWK